MKCTDCIRLDVLTHMYHSKQGFGKCPDDDLGQFKAMNYERDCKKFTLMTEEQQKARHDAWLLKKNPPKRVKTEEGEANE